MEDLKVVVSLYNGEYVVEPCIKALKKVFRDFFVVDVGSEDDGPKVARGLGVEVIEYGRLSATISLRFLGGCGRGVALPLP
jgi:glycosyltransferase involved in cell wall biosynthesis